MTLLAVALGVTLGGCAAPTPDAGTAGGPGGEITVFAAASLTESFTRIARNFEATNPGIRVSVNFAGSSALATQINQGAPADVFAAASPETMRRVVDEGNVSGTPAVFVRNRLVIAVPKGNPDGVTGPHDLTRPGMKVALCAEQVPCGAAAKTALGAANAAVTPVTLEPDVKAALAKVALGEVDAALVYRTDVQARASDVDGVEFPEAAHALNDYSVAVLEHSPNRAGAEAFLAYVLSPPAAAVLTEAGFQVR